MKPFDSEPPREPPDALIDLVDRFGRHVDAYRSGQYKEAQLRKEFIDPFFELLGWDVNNRRGYAEAYKEVVHEDSIRIGGLTKAPDYSFRIGGTRKYFVEAKKPSVNIKDDPGPAYQLRRYAWSAKLPVSILTDFEELAIYDCTVRPFQGDAAATARVGFMEFRDYPAKWGQLANVFSRDAILQGSFDKYAESSKRKRGTASVDKAFLSEIEEWRVELTKGIRKRNRELSQPELNFAVARTIDRIVFLRICEDRGIEPYGRLRQTLNGHNVYARLLELFHSADDRYNSGLFHFRHESGEADEPDAITPALQIDDRPLKRILKNLYYPDSPYAFSVVPADILGQVYERFLGKTIELVGTQSARITEKPEVRKAGGVYYTPTWVVNYIVKECLGPALADKAPKDVRHLRILDPACGSGSFLLGAYDYLIRWHNDWYIEHLVVDGKYKARKGYKQNPPIFQTRSDEWRLTTAEKRRILLNNIYGVDVDPQAVEVAKLNLLLRVLEDESQETLQLVLEIGHQRALPNLGRNIRCGNSLVGPDYYDDPRTHDGEAVNTFNWDEEFPDAARAGGFDAVIGNPPYGMLQPNNTEPAMLGYLRSRYPAVEFKMDMYHLFLQRGVNLLNEGGRLGYIVPTTLLNNVYASTLREWLTERCCIERISVARERVFEDADVYTTVAVLRSEPAAKQRNENAALTTSNFSETFTQNPTPLTQTRQHWFRELPGGTWNIMVDDERAPLITKLTQEFENLADANIKRGAVTGSRAKFFSETKETNKHVPVLTGTDIQRYGPTVHNEYLRFEKPKSGGGGCWDPDVQLAPHKVVIRQIGTGPIATMAGPGQAITANAFAIQASNKEEELYILGVVNSKLSEFFWATMFEDFKNTFPQVTKASLSLLPMRPKERPRAFEKDRQKLINLVERTLEANQSFALAKTANERETAKRKARALEEQVDKLVFEIFALTNQEAALVERVASERRKAK